VNLLIEHALIVTCDARRSILEDALLAIEGDRIVAVGAAAGAEAYAAFPRYDATGKTILPGLINSHTHTVLTVLRGTVEDMAGDAVYGYMSPISYAMQPEERAAMARLGALEALRSGTATLVENFRHVVTYGEALVDTGMRVYLAENCADAQLLRIRHGEYSYNRTFGEEFLARQEALIERFHGRDGGRVQAQVAAHATDNCSPWMLERLRLIAERHGPTRTIHLAQGTGEVAQVRRAYDRTPAEYLRDYGWAASDVVGAHWTFCTPDDIALLAARGVHMAHCPANSSRRGPHKARLDLIRDACVNIAFGTDNMTEDLFQTMHVGSIVYRGSYGNGVAPQPQEVLDGITVNGAKALGRDDLGTIKAGAKADLTILDLSTPALRPVISLVSNIVHYGHPGAVDGVMVDGRFLMRDRQVLAFDERRVLADAEAAARAAAGYPAAGRRGLACLR
jgi:5-methylthioadenosine/S-adenosylhomocysteine deaminase